MAFTVSMSPRTSVLGRRKLQRSARGQKEYPSLFRLRPNIREYLRKQGFGADETPCTLRTLRVSLSSTFGFR